MMRIVKKLPFFVLILAMILAIIPATAQATERTTQEKAVVLGNLKIISGVNGEFYLDNQLRKNEAATFIVRLIGKGDYVNQNKNQYSITPYTDVPSTEWYAPFIGYCSQNGFITETSAEFKPLDYITEKDFIGLVLVALDYRKGIDFTADTAYEKAREIGLISLTDYINHVNDNLIAKRGAAVEIMYKALTMDCREGDQILLQKMIDAEVVTRLQAMAMGLLVDSVFTGITNVESIDLNKIQVTMNEPVSAVSDVLIYSDDQVDIECSVLSVDDETVTIETDPLVAGKEYIIELLDVKDKEGNLTPKLMELFTGFEVLEVTSDFFRISRIEPVNARSVKAFFTHPLSVNSEIVLYYTLSQDSRVIADGRLGRIRAGVLNSDNNGVLLSLDSDLLKDGEVYTLSIDGDMMSAYGAGLNDGAGDSMKFIAKDDKDSKFELLELIPVDKNTLLLNFSKEINPFLAKQVFNFYLTDEDNDPVPITSTALDIRGRAVYLNLGNSMIKNHKYFLTINNLNDITKQEFITEKVYTFEADYDAVGKFKLNRASAIDNQTIELTFNKPLDSETATDPSNYSIYRVGSSSTMKTDKVLYDPGSRYKVKLFLAGSSKLYSQNKYEVRISGNSVKDYLGNGIESANERLSGTNRDRAAMAIESAVAISTDAVKLSFSQEIGFDAGNLMPAHFTLEYNVNFMSIKKVPISVIYGDAKTLVLKFDSLEYDTQYSVKVSEMLDYSGSTIKGLEKDFVLVSQ